MDFKQDEREGWSLVEKLAEEAAAVKAAPVGDHERQRVICMSAPLWRLVKKETVRNQYEVDGIMSLVKEVERACQSYLERIGWALRLDAEQPRGGVSEEERQLWWHYLTACEEVDCSGFTRDEANQIGLQVV